MGDTSDQAGQAGLTDRQHDWVAATFGVDPRTFPAKRAKSATGDEQLGAASSGKAKAPEKPEFSGPQTNPFNAPQAQIEIEKLTLPTIRNLAGQQALHAFQTFTIAVANVKAKKKAAADADAAKRELMTNIIITLALMPLGPVVEAAANAVVGPKLQNALAEVIVNNAANLEAKFGAKGAQAANKAFDLVAGEAVTNLAAKFDAGKAKGALDAGISALKDKTVKFVATSDHEKCVENYLDAVLKAADDAMPNLINVIGTTGSYSEAVAYFNLFNLPLQASYEAMLSQQVDDMLSEMADVLAEKGQPQVIGASEGGTTTALDEIASVILSDGRKMLAHVSRSQVITMFKTFDSLSFVKWVTPDMQAQALKLVKEEVKISAFGKDQHVPEPQREPGERVVMVDWQGKDRLMLIEIEDEGIFWKDYGVRKFKQWAEGEEDERVFRTRGEMQIGRIDKLPLNSIKGVPRS